MQVINVVQFITILVLLFYASSLDTHRIVYEIRNSTWSIKPFTPVYVERILPGEFEKWNKTEVEVGNRTEGGPKNLSIEDTLDGFGTADICNHKTVDLEIPVKIEQGNLANHTVFKALKNGCKNKMPFNVTNDKTSFYYIKEYFKLSPNIGPFGIQAYHNKTDDEYIFMIIFNKPNTFRTKIKNMSDDDALQEKLLKINTEILNHAAMLNAHIDDSVPIDDLIDTFPALELQPIFSYLSNRYNIKWSRFRSVNTSKFSADLKMLLNSEISKTYFYHMLKNMHEQLTHDCDNAMKTIIPDMIAHHTDEVEQAQSAQLMFNALAQNLKNTLMKKIRSAAWYMEGMYDDVLTEIRNIKFGVSSLSFAEIQNYDEKTIEGLYDNRTYKEPYLETIQKVRKIQREYYFKLASLNLQPYQYGQIVVNHINYDRQSKKIIVPSHMLIPPKFGPTLPEAWNKGKLSSQLAENILKRVSVILRAREGGNKTYDSMYLQMEKQSLECYRRVQDPHLKNKDEKDLDDILRSRLARKVAYDEYVENRISNESIGSLSDRQVFFVAAVENVDYKEFNDDNMAEAFKCNQMIRSKTQQDLLNCDLF